MEGFCAQYIRCQVKPYYELVMGKIVALIYTLDQDTFPQVVRNGWKRLDS